MINTATRPAPPNMAIGPQLRPGLTLTGATGLRPFPPAPLAGGRPAGGFAPARFAVRVAAFAAVRAPGRDCDLGSVLGLAAGASESITSSLPPVAAALLDAVFDGRRTSPVLMLMGPRHGRLSG